MPRNRKSVPGPSRLDPWRCLILLTEKPDDELAQKAGVSRATVERYRRKVRSWSSFYAEEGLTPLKVCPCCSVVSVWSQAELESVFGLRPRKKKGQTVLVAQSWCRSCRRRGGPPRTTNEQERP
jgi:hypothetical protein